MSDNSKDPVVDAAFRTVSKNTPCFVIWRIENFQPVPVPKDQYGSFYDGDSYLVLAAKESYGALDVRIHFWLGNQTTQDESGAAAIKAVELDDYLGGTPVQYRETEGHESKIFLNYFKTKGGIKYMPGGQASGFTHVDHQIKPRLMHVKGKNCPRIREIPIEWSSMNDGDAYILDIGQAFYVWNGKSCSRTERIKAMQYARKLRDDRGKGNMLAVEDGDESADVMGAAEFQLFDEYLPLSKKPEIKEASAGGADDAYEMKAMSELKLWKCSEEGNQLKVTEISQKPLKKEQLDTNDVFIVDNGEAGIWVWCGKKASKKEKKEGMSNATAFLTQRNYPASVQVSLVHESGEPALFKALFHIWEKEKIPGSTKPFNPNKIARTVQTKFDAATMHDHPEVAKETGMVDDGTGTKKIWRIERTENTYEMVELEKKFYGQLYGGDSYIILYTFLVNNREQYIIYFWLGKKSSADERGVAAKKAVELDDSLNGAAKQVRVVQAKEPPHFMAMFGGKLIIFAGGKAGWGANEQDEGPGDTYMLHVRGTSQYNTKAEQVPCRAESLNSNDVFVLFSKNGVFIWAGKGCTGDEREMAKQVAAVSPRGSQMVVEGQEKEDFWNLLGGKAEYATSPRLVIENDERPPRLFQCSNASGAFTVNEIVEFNQQDLVTDDVFILDAYDNIFLWTGEQARPEEKTMSMDAALEYLETDPSGRDVDTPVFIVKQGLEPPDFVGYFGIWSREYWSQGKSYEQLKKELGEDNISMDTVTAKSKDAGDASFSEVAKFPYSVLKDKNRMPPGLDFQHKEKHLSDEEFQKVFNMSYAEFVQIPAWKQERMKKSTGLW